MSIFRESYNEDAVISSLKMANGTGRYGGMSSGSHTTTAALAGMAYDAQVSKLFSPIPRTGDRTDDAAELPGDTAARQLGVQLDYNLVDMGARTSTKLSDYEMALLGWKATAADRDSAKVLVPVWNIPASDLINCSVLFLRDFRLIKQDLGEGYLFPDVGTSITTVTSSTSPSFGSVTASPFPSIYVMPTKAAIIEAMRANGGDNCTYHITFQIRCTNTFNSPTPARGIFLIDPDNVLGGLAKNGAGTAYLTRVGNGAGVSDLMTALGGPNAKMDQGLYLYSVNDSIPSSGGAVNKQILIQFTLAYGSLLLVTRVAGTAV